MDLEQITALLGGHHSLHHREGKALPIGGNICARDPLDIERILRGPRIFNDCHILVSSWMALAVEYTVFR
jgi:hypothetical protein